MITKRSGIEKQLQQLDSALSTSFTNLKRDLSDQEKTMEEFKSKFANLERMVKQLKQEISKLRTQRSQESKVFGERSAESTERSVSVRRTPNAGLTPLHIEMLKRLMLLQMENSKRGISMRKLAAEIYPAKPYPRIKSTLSEYVKKLHQAGLIEKHMSGRLYLSFTEKALEYADEKRLNKMKELISLPFGKSFGVR